MTIDLEQAVAALDALTPLALQSADSETLRKFHQLAIRWSQLAANETRGRAKLRRAKTSSSDEPTP
jgi:hypothetical protein